MTLEERTPQQCRLKDNDPAYSATVANGVIDIHSPRRSYSCLVDEAAYILLCEAKAINELLESVDEKRQRIAALETELLGEHKANTLLNAGMGSVCDGRDELKHENRAMKVRIAELEEALRPFALGVYPGIGVMPDDACCLEVPPGKTPGIITQATLGDCRRAAAVLKDANANKGGER